MITLAEAKVGMADKFEQSVVDEFRRSSRLLDLLPFDDAVSPGTGGSTLTYGYTLLLTPSTASGRAINKNYTANEAKRTSKTVNLKIFGGSFSIDRVIANTSGSIDEVNFQLNQKIIGAKNLFHYLVINGDSTVQDSAGDYLEFDGLNRLLTGASTVVTSTVDISTSALLSTNYQAFLDEVDEWLGKLDEKPDALLMNGKMLTKMKSVARRAGYYSRSEDAFGRGVDNYDGIEMIDLQKYYNGTNTVDCIATDATSGKTDIYAVKFGQNAFHGVSVNGSKIINTHLPDFTTAGAVKEGDVEFVAAVALKSTLKAGKLAGIKVQ